MKTIVIEKKGSYTRVPCEHEIKSIPDGDSYFYKRECIKCGFSEDEIQLEDI